jgi:chemotaxis signal transduction protein
MLETKFNGPQVELYCSFWLGEHCFGVPSIAVSEVHRSVPITTIPGAPSAVSGYVNLRGQLYLVLDPYELLIGESAADNRGAELIVFRPEVGEAFALRVLRVGEMLPIPGAEIHTPKARTGDVDLSNGAQRHEALIAGHATLESHLVTLIDPSKLLPAALLAMRP